ncbi:MAG: translation initiation factor IF-2 [Ruminococcaceae bacterium]|nr:translation initiation factor IF-2 [Oscillospiraceae bacterium]
MANMKYRVHEFAKDMGVKTKDVADVLTKYGMTPKNHMTILEDKELDLLFDYFTKQKEAADFEPYFALVKPVAKEEASAEPIAEKVPEEAPTKTETVKEPKKAEAKSEKPAAKAPAKQPAKEKASNISSVKIDTTVAADTKKPQQEVAKKPQQEAAKKPEKAEKPHQAQPQQNQRDQKKQRTFETQQRAPQQPRNPQKQQKQPAKPIQNQPQQPVAVTTIEEQKRRVVDTRGAGAHVDLSKYDERLENFVPDRLKNSGKETQKIKKNQSKPFGKRETEAEKLNRLALEKAKKAPLKITIPDEISVGELATRLKKNVAEVVKKLISLGVMANASQVIDFDTAAICAEELGAKVEHEIVVTIEERLIDDSVDTDENLVPRAPVVVVMGHVDHGKTSLLDAIKNSHVTSTEAGGITQHIGAYRVNIDGRDITFLDTPGHEAFTAMRARGAQATDIAILVVAADDGIMPQTIEAINHAKAANVPIIVAMNKMDKYTANPDRIKQQLTEHGLVVEEWGGDTICVPVSALEKTGIPELLEMVLLVADMQNLRANPDRAAKGIVIESRLDKGRGVVATLLVQNGTLHSGDIIIAGTSVGRVRAMTNDKGKKIDAAAPSVPVEIIGLAEVPSAGDLFYAVADEKMARQLADQRRDEEKERIFKLNQKGGLEDLFNQLGQGTLDLNLIVKADVQGSVEAIKTSLEKLSNEEVRVRVIHGGVGGINESDIMLASASNAIVVGFNVRPDSTARASAEANKVDIRTYRVIYDCIDEITAAMKGLLAPKYVEELLGYAEVRQTFKVSGVGTIAGCYVKEGKITRNAQLRIVRDGVVIAEDKIDSLKRFKDDAKEVLQGFECGIGLEHFNDVREGDIYEAFIMKEVER